MAGRSQDLARCPRSAQLCGFRLLSRSVNARRLIGFAEALSIAFQVTGVPVAQELIALFPYLTTVAVLIVFRGDRWAPPRSLGRI